jgi:hypothetical protein
MKLHMFCKYVGLAAGVLGGLLILLGMIGFFTGELLSVQDYRNFFWLSQPVYAVAGNFRMVTYVACNNHCACCKEDKQ